MSVSCDLCGAEFPDDEELGHHIEMEAAVDWPLDGYDPSTYAAMK